MARRVIRTAVRARVRERGREREIEIRELARIGFLCIIRVQARSRACFV